MGSVLVNTVKKILRIREVGILIPLIIIVIIASIFTDAFATAANMVNLARAISFTVIGAVGMTFILISGGLDLSVGSTLGLGSMVVGYFLQMPDLPSILAILFALVATTTVGLFNGFVISKLTIPPLIVTLGTMNIARGIIHIMTPLNLIGAMSAI